MKKETAFALRSDQFISAPLIASLLRPYAIRKIYLKVISYLPAIRVAKELTRNNTYLIDYLNVTEQTDGIAYEGIYLKSYELLLGLPFNDAIRQDKFMSLLADLPGNILISSIEFIRDNEIMNQPDTFGDIE